MDQNIVLRKAEIGDIEQIKTILFSSLEEYKIDVPENYPVSDIDSVGTQNASESVFVLSKDDSVMGFVILRPITRDTVELKRLYLASPHRGQGLGAYLLNHAINFAHENHFTSMRLETTSRFREAVALYKKHGFIELKDVQKSPGHDLAFQKRIT